jgi:hypothetical protein
MKNRDFIEIDTDVGAFWCFTIPSNATNCTEATEETIEHCRELFRCFDGFIIPTRIECTLLYYDGEETDPRRISREEFTDRERPSVQSEDGISFDQFSDIIPGESTDPMCIATVDFKHNNIAVHLKDEVSFIGQAGQSHSQLRPSDPYLDPLRITLRYFPNREQPDINTKGFHQIMIKANSDIWFEQSEIGENNRELITDFFNSIVDALPVEMVEYDRDHGARKKLYFD